MANQNIARLGVVLGIDMAEFSAGIDKAIQENKKLKRAIESESKAAAKEIIALKYATDDYGKSVTKAELIQREFMTGGKYANLTKELKDQLLQQAKAYDAVAASAKNAQAQQQGASVGMLGGREGMKQLTQQQIAALSYQTTDIVTQLASGQNPLIILIQQGGQLRDQFGGFVPLFNAIKTVFTATRVAAVGLAGVMGTLAFAAYRGAEEFQRLRDDLILTNNYAGVTVSSFNSLVATLSKVSNISIGSSKDIFSQLVASGKFTQESMYAVGEAIARVAKLSGEAANEVAQKLIPSFDGSASSAKRLNDQYRFLTLEQYKQIEQLNFQGKSQEAARVTAEALTNSLKGQTRELGLLEQAYSTVKIAASSFWDYLLSIGKSDTTRQTVENLRNAMIFAAERLQGKLSPMARANAQKAFDAALEAYQSALSKLENEEQAARSKSEELTKEQVRLELYEKAGGLAKYRSLVEENQKILNETEFNERVKGLNQLERIELDYARRIREYSSEQLRLSEEEKGVFLAQRMKNIADKSIQEWARAEQAKAEITRQEFITFQERQATERLSIEQEKQKQDIYRNSILITEKDLKLAEARLRTEAEIARIMRNAKLDPSAKEELVKQQEALGRAREAVVEYGMQFDILKNSNNAVFSSMNQAIDNFVETGKFKFADFASSVIKQLLKIQLQAQATQILGMAGSGIGSLFNLGARTAMESSPSFVGPLSMFATAADGGYIDKPTIVGEGGPELFLPRTAGTIVPNQQMNNVMNGGNTYVTNNYIDAIDTKSFEDRLYSSSKAVWAANQYGNKNISTSRMRT